jgi:hypothetical protein
MGIKELISRRKKMKNEKEIQAKERDYCLNS